MKSLETTPKETGIEVHQGDLGRGQGHTLGQGQDPILGHLEDQEPQGVQGPFPDLQEGQDRQDDHCQGHQEGQLPQGDRGQILHLCINHLQGLELQRLLIQDHPHLHHKGQDQSLLKNRMFKFQLYFINQEREKYFNKGI